MRTLPKTTPEQRAPFYGDVEDLTSVGFLSHPVEVNGSHLAFRSLCPGDIFLLRARSAGQVELDWQCWLIASSIWMVNGYSLLEEPNTPFHVNKFVRGVTKNVREILYGLVMGLFARQNAAIEAVEAYCYEYGSRYRWKAISGALNSHTGVPGTDRLGMNPVMQMWRFFNEVEDQRIAEETQWDGFKLTASASAPKGVQKIDKHDRSRRESEQNRRQDVLDRFYYIRQGIVPPDAKTTDMESIALRSKSVEDLEVEMRRWVTGEFDWHDEVVNQYKSRITERYERERQEREARRLALRKKYDEMELSTVAQPLKAYTPEQLQAIVQGRRPGVATVYEGDPRGVQEKMYHKHLLVAEKGLLDADGNNIVAPQVDPSLMSLISDRKVPFKTEE